MFWKAFGDRPRLGLAALHRSMIMCGGLLVLGGVHAADDVPPHARAFLKAYCIDCHGAQKQKGDLRLDDLGAIDGKDLNRWGQVLELIEAREMPPPKAEQPTAAVQDQFTDWLLAALDSAGSDASFKRQMPDKGNYVPHEHLFGPTAKRVPGATAPRLWRLNPRAYQRVVFGTFGVGELFKKNRGGTNLTAPFLMTSDRGIRDYAFRYAVRGGEIEQFSAQVLEAVRGLQRDRNLPEAVRRGLGYGERRAKEPTPADISATVTYLFTALKGRAPKIEEIQRYTAFAERRITSLGFRDGVLVAYMPIFTHPSIIYRSELGAGPVDEHGRRRLSAMEIASALAYALIDGPPDHELLAAIPSTAEHSLETMAGRRFHIDRLYLKYAPLTPAADGKEQMVLRRSSKLLRFFREYFDYSFATEIFKDSSERRKYKVHSYRPHEKVLSADTMVAELVYRDKDVLRQILTFKTPSSGFPGGKHWLNHKYEKKPKGDTSPRKIARQARVVYWKPSKRDPLRTGMLLQPAWLIAHSDNFDNHPIKRGRWVRERLLGGHIPDIPITVDAQLPDEPQSTLRHRMRVTREPKCWLCHKSMDSLGLVFEGFNHFAGRRQEEHGKPVDTSGAITGSLDPSLNGPLQDAEELILRLADSEHVEQVFVRHVFRFYLGRNETPSDAATLQDAHAAYKDSGGSMQALVTAILCSDAFLYRWANSSADGVR